MSETTTQLSSERLAEMKAAVLSWPAHKTEACLPVAQAITLIDMAAQSLVLEEQNANMRQAIEASNNDSVLVKEIDILKSRNAELLRVLNELQSLPRNGAKRF